MDKKNKILIAVASVLAVIVAVLIIVFCIKGCDGKKEDPASTGVSSSEVSSSEVSSSVASSSEASSSEEEENILDGLQVEIIPSGEGEEEDDEFFPGAW